jgi:uncharacterized integral membrane protein
MNLIKKWLFRLLVVLVFVVAMLAASDNSTEVPLTFLEYKTPEWPISWWMLSAFVFGVLFGTLLNTWSNTKLRINARSANKKVEKTVRELDKTKSEPLPIELQTAEVAEVAKVTKVAKVADGAEATMAVEQK